MSLRVQLATDADIQEWLQLAAEVSDLFGAEMANDPGFQSMLQRNVARSTALCVRVDGRLAGGMLLRERRINWLGVRKDFRRQGVGRALVAHAVSASDADVFVVTFGEEHAHPDAAGARELFTAMGFEVSGAAPERAPDGTPRLIMVRRAEHCGLANPALRPTPQSRRG
jgi:GNAT superfamily N-acetyltransferase